MQKITTLPTQDIPFGHSLLPYFALEQGYRMTNAGANGVTPNYVMDARKKYYREIENNPDFSYRITHHKYLAERKEIVSKYLNASASDIVLIENATEGVNSVLKSIKYSEGDVILLFDTIYRMVEEVSRFLVDKFKAELVIVPTSQEILNSPKKLVGLAEEYITKYSNRIKIAVVDHVSSFPSTIFPVKEIVSLFREHNILCFVDAAHALGQVNVDLQDLNPDIYLTNLHKWGYCSKSVAALYVKKDFQSIIRPVMTSHAYKVSFEEDFVFLGTRDYSPIYSSKESFEFIESLGDQRIKKHNHELALQVGKEVAKIWDTEVLVTEESMVGAMTTILLPYQGKDVESKLGLEFCEKYNTFLKIGQYQGKYYARFCAQIFNELEDFVFVANAVKDTLNIKGV